MTSLGLLRSAILGVSAGLVFGQTALADCDGSARELSLHHTAAATANSRAMAASALATRVAMDMPGRLCISVTPRSEPLAQGGLVEGLSTGAFDMAIVPTGALGGVSRRFLIFDLPFLFDDIESVLAYQESTTGQQLLAEAAPVGAHGLAFFIDGFDQIAARLPVVTPADLTSATFRIRDSELERSTAVTIEAEPVVLPDTEAGPAFAEDRVQALDGSWSALLSDREIATAAGFTETNHTIQQNILVVSSDVWASLDPQSRALLEQIAVEVAHERNRLVFELNEAAKYAIPVTRVRTLTSAERLVWKRAMQNVWFGFGGDIGFDQISTALHANRFN